MLAKLSVRVSVGLNACASAGSPLLPPPQPRRPGGAGWAGRAEQSGGGGASGAEGAGRTRRAASWGAGPAAAGEEERKGRCPAGQRGKKKGGPRGRVGRGVAPGRRGAAGHDGHDSLGLGRGSAVPAGECQEARRGGRHGQGCPGDEGGGRAVRGPRPGRRRPWGSAGRTWAGVNTAGCCPVGSWRQSGRPRAAWAAAAILRPASRRGGPQMATHTLRADPRVPLPWCWCGGEG